MSLRAKASREEDKPVSPSLAARCVLRDTAGAARPGPGGRTARAGAPTHGKTETLRSSGRSQGQQGGLGSRDKPARSSPHFSPSSLPTSRDGWHCPHCSKPQLSEGFYFFPFIFELGKTITSGAAAAGRIPGRAAAAAPAARGMQRPPVSTRADHRIPLASPPPPPGRCPWAVSAGCPP